MTTKDQAKWQLDKIYWFMMRGSIGHFHLHPESKGEE